MEEVMAAVNSEVFGVWFLIGAALGKTLYRRKASLLPRVSARNPVRRALCLIGRHSLELYLLHQPILAALVWIFS